MTKLGQNQLHQLTVSTIFALIYAHILINAHPPPVLMSKGQIFLSNLRKIKAAYNCPLESIVSDLIHSTMIKSIFSCLKVCPLHNSLKTHVFCHKKADLLAQSDNKNMKLSSLVRPKP